MAECGKCKGPVVGRWLLVVGPLGSFVGDGCCERRSTKKSGLQICLQAALFYSCHIAAGWQSRSAADVDHGAGGADEVGLADVMAFFLALHD